MSAGKFNMVVEQGSTFRKQLQVKGSDGTPVNLTGYQVRGQIRIAFEDVNPTASFTCTITDAVNGIVEIVLTATLTEDLSFTKGVYDIELVAPGGAVTRLLQGNVILSKEVTR